MIATDQDVEKESRGMQAGTTGHDRPSHLHGNLIKLIKSDTNGSWFMVHVVENDTEDVRF